jgi:hypothetical protein
LLLARPPADLIAACRAGSWSGQYPEGSTMRERQRLPSRLVALQGVVSRCIGD